MIDSIIYNGYEGLYIEENQINWLKSLKDRVQPKQEWSIDDEYMLKDICYAFEKGSSQYRWLKSLIPQNRWKPSDEQLRQLELAIDYWQPNNTEVTTPLFKLWEDLKKLKAGKL